MEIWKSIPSDPTLEASSEGRIRVVPHFGPLPNGGQRIYGGIPTKGQWDKDNKRYIYCRKHHKTRHLAVLVCEAFYGLASKDKPYCIHIDENSRNNKSGNLKWGTQKENLNCPGFVAYCKSRTGENSPIAKGKKVKK